MPRYAENTSVASDRSRAEIERTLRSGCGHEFERTGEGWLSHPLPWCGPFIGGQYQPVPTATS